MRGEHYLISAAVIMAPLDTVQLLPRLEMESDLLRHGDTPSLELRFRPGRINIDLVSFQFSLYLLELRFATDLERKPWPCVSLAWARLLAGLLMLSLMLSLSPSSSSSGHSLDPVSSTASEASLSPDTGPDAEELARLRPESLIVPCILCITRGSAPCILVCPSSHVCQWTYVTVT